MNGGIHLILVDGDVRRRARISHGLSDRGLHVEPFEDIAELIAHWPGAGLILVHDDDGTIDRLVAHMGQSGQWLPAVAFADAPTARRVAQAVHAGVLDYVAWPFDHDELVEALTAAQEKGKTLTHAKLREAMARSRIEKLSEREREVLEGVARGLSNDAIARQLGISSRTVEIHRANMLTKIGASHTSEAIRIAIEASLIY